MLVFGSCCRCILKLMNASVFSFMFCMSLFPFFPSFPWFLITPSAWEGKGAGASCHPRRNHEWPWLRQQHRHLCHHQTRSGLHPTLPGVRVQRQQVGQYEYNFIQDLLSEQILKRRDFSKWYHIWWDFWWIFMLNHVCKSDFLLSESWISLVCHWQFDYAWTFSVLNCDLTL